MTLDDFARLAKYATKNILLHDLVLGIAKFVGLEIPTGGQAQTKRHMTNEEWMRFVDQTGGRIDGVPRL